MKKRLPLLALALVALLFAGGLGWLYRLRISGGDVFPAYSSLRADPLGTRGFYEALAAQPEVQVERWLRPLEKLEQEPARTLFLVGMNRGYWEALPLRVSNAVDAAVRAGSRVVVIFAAEQEPVSEDVAYEPPRKSAKTKKKDEPSKTDKMPAHEPGRRPDRSAADAPVAVTDWTRLWGTAIKRRLIMDGDEGARSEHGRAEMPQTVPWKSDVYFEPTQGSGWKVLYSRGGSPVLMELDLERGSVVLATDSYFVSNEALQKDRAPALLAWLVGEHRRVVFSEAHLGVEEDRGVAGLARHYGLSGGFFVFVVLALLFVWRRMALFVPPAPEADELRLSYNQTAGLEALLRRVLPAARLLPTCADEWARTARPAELAKLNTVLREQPSRAPAAAQYNAAVRAFRRH